MKTDFPSSLFQSLPINHLLNFISEVSTFHAVQHNRLKPCQQQILPLLPVWGAYLGLAVLLGLVAAKPAHAKTGFWETESATYSGIANLSCGGSCHDIDPPSSSLKIGNFTVASDAPSVNLAPPAFAGTNFSWRFRKNGTTGPGTFIDGRNDSGSQPHNFPIGESTISLDYCIGVDDGTTVRKFRCDMVKVTRDAAPEPPNLPPVITEREPAGLIKLTEGGSSATVTLTVKDEDSKSLKYSSSNNHSQNLTVTTGENGSFILNPLKFGSANIELIVTDDKNQNTIEQVSVEIGKKVVDPPPNTPANIIAIKPDKNIKLELGKAITVTLVVEDAEGDDLEFTGTSDNTFAADVKSNGDGSYEVTSGTEQGQAELTLAVHDGTVFSIATVIVDVVGPLEPANKAPVAVDDRIELASVTESQLLDVLTNDSDDLTPVSSLQIQVSDVTTKQGGQLDVIGSEIKYTPPENLTNNDSFTYRLFDSGNEPSGFANVTLVVPKVETNLPPKAVRDSFTIKNASQSQLLKVLANDSDPEDEKLTIILVAKQSDLGGNLAIEGDQIRYTPPAELTSEDSFKYRVADPGKLESDDVEVTLKPPEPVNSAPGAALYETKCSSCHSTGLSGVPQLGNDAEWIRRLSAAPDGIATLVSSVVKGKGGMPAFGTSPDSQDELRKAVEFLTGGVTASPPDQDNDQTPDSTDNCISIPNDQSDQDHDGVGDACDDTDGNNPEEPPVARNDSFVLVDSSGIQTLNVLDNDTDLESMPLTISLDSSSTQLGGKIELSESATKVKYTAPESLSQQDTFSYKAVDATGLKSNSAVVTIVPSDTDGDGVFDIKDNCDLTTNPDQDNMDSDDLGDACDPDPDGDGKPGTSGQTLDSGKALVVAECILCHLNPNIGAPQFGDAAAWKARLEAAGSIENLVLSTINGIPNTAMPAFGGKFTAKELTAAVLYLSGNESSQTDNPESVVDTDGDTIADAEDNCDRLPNTNQDDADLNGVGDACEPTADSDGDGYIFALDDDDSNANRLPGSSASVANTAFFTSDQSLSLGLLAMSAATNATAGVMLNDLQFTNAASTVYPGVQAALDSAIRNGTQIMDIRLEASAGGSATLIVQLLNNIPLSPQFRIYTPEQAAWSGFTVSGADSLASAQAANGACPVSESSNYTAGLRAGLSCIKLDIVDGGPNDTDTTPNGTVSLTARVGTPASNDAGTTSPETVDSTPQKGGGGSTGFALLYMMTMWLAVRWRRRASGGIAA